MSKKIFTYGVTDDLQVQKTGISFKNARSFLKHVDSLYTGPGWMCQIIDIEGEDGALK